MEREASLGKSERQVYIGDVPPDCQICATPLTDSFVDGKTIFGPWAFLCLPCHVEVGVGLGIGKGQWYAKDNDEWVLVAGGTGANLNKPGKTPET